MNPHFRLLNFTLIMNAAMFFGIPAEVKIDAGETVDLEDLVAEKPLVLIF